MAWLLDWAKRTKATSDNTNIDSDLSQFQNRIFLGKYAGQSDQDLSRVFDEVGANSKKIAVTLVDGDTQIYGDIESWDSVGISASKGTPNATRDLGSSDDGAAGMSIYGSPIDNATYYTFDGSSDGLYKGTDLGDSSTEVIWAKVRIHDKDKGVAQTIWKDGGYENGVAVGINAQGSIGIFGRNSGVFSSITIPSFKYENNIWYDIFFTKTRVSIVDSSGDVVATASGLISPANGSAAESIGYVTSQSPITGATGSNIEFFDGDIDDIEIYTSGDLTAPIGKNAIIHVSSSAFTLLTASDTEFYIYYDNTKTDNTTYISESGGVAAQSVYPTDVKLHQNMNQDPSGSAPQMLDSTVDNNDGTSSGSMTSSDLVDSGVGKALNPDGVDDSINCGSDSSIDDIFSGGGAIQAIIKPDGWGQFNFGRIAASSPGTDNDNSFQFYISNINDSLELIISTTGTDGQWRTPANSIVLGNLYYVAVDYDSDDIGNDPIFYLNGVSVAVTEANTPTGTVTSDAGNDKYIGSRGTNREFRGLIGEVVFSNSLSASWIKATNYALKDDLLAYGTEELYSGTKVDTPDISPTSGAVPSGQLITLTSANADSIYWTDDGVDPTPGDNLYSVPFAITSAVTIKAYGVAAGLDDSDVASESYTISAAQEQPIITIIT